MKWIVYAEKTATKSYEVEAETKEEAIQKVAEEEYPADPITIDDFGYVDFYV